LLHNDSSVNENEFSRKNLNTANFGQISRKLILSKKEQNKRPLNTIDKANSPLHSPADFKSDKHSKSVERPTTEIKGSSDYMLIGQEDLKSNETQTGSRCSSKLHKFSKDEQQSELTKRNLSILHPEIKVMTPFATNQNFYRTLIGLQSDISELKTSSFKGLASKRKSTSKSKQKTDNFW
jgi:hypothetical protein